MKRLRKWDIVIFIVLLALSLTCLGMGFESFYSAQRYDLQSLEAMREQLVAEEDLVEELSEQTAYLESNPEDVVLSHIDFLTLVNKERKSFLSQQKVLLFRSAASSQFAKGAFLLALVGWLGVVIGWLYTLRSQVEKPEVAKQMGGKSRESDKKPK